MFAVALILVPPVVLLLAELLVGLVSRRATQALHLVFVVGLGALIVLQVAKRVDPLPPWAAVAAAVGVGVAVGILYARTSLVPTILTVAGPAPIVFLALFVYVTPVSKLIFVEEVAVRTAAVRSNTPVVLVVFDEFSTVALMDANRRIDAARYPNFAALARDSTWYRDNTTVHAHTEKAVPAILTGRLPSSDQLPVYADHPRNLFTLVGGYHMNVLETLTSLCPRSLCKGGNASFEPEGVAQSTRAESLVSDAAVVYLHVLLPERLTGRLPPITDTWTNFRGAGESDEASEPRACGRKICAFTARISASRGPSLSFLHSLLPHVPWQYLPQGRRYANEVRRIPGLENARWGGDEWLIEQGYQRYLLQLGYTDSALGVVLERLRAAGMYDRALVVFTADHGVGFTANEPRRLVTARNLHDIAFAPLFVKLPRQRTGRIVDGLVRSVDILPTVAAALRIRSPWRFDGRSLLDRRPARDGRVVISGNAGSFSASLTLLLRRQRAALRRQLAWFGSGSFDRVYRIGAHRALIGRSVSELRVAESGGASASLSGASLLRDVDVRSDLVPNYLTGTVSGAGTSPESLAIAVNGVIAAVTRTYSSFGRTRFAAMVSPSTLRAGENAYSVYAIRGAGLERLGGDTDSFTLERREGRVVLASAVRTIRVVPGALRGDARGRVRKDTVLFGGWAVDPRARRAAESVVVFAGGASVYVGSASNYARPDVERRYGVQEAGFIFEVPRSAVGSDLRDVRVFVTRGLVASELPLRH